MTTFLMIFIANSSTLLLVAMARYPAILLPARVVATLHPRVLWAVAAVTLVALAVHELFVLFVGKLLPKLVGSVNHFQSSCCKTVTVFVMFAYVLFYIAGTIPA
jgi:hypothetical protein